MQIPRWKVVLSYVFPFQISEMQSFVSGQLKLWLVNGRITLDTRQANYSFGALHQVFRRAFRKTRFREFPPGEVLLLGLGGGSVPAILFDELKLDIHMTAVEIDPVMVQIAREYFAAGRRSRLTIIEQDAAIYMDRPGKQFATIVVDLFIDNRVPACFTQPDFLGALRRSIADNGRLYFNMITEGEEQKKQYRQLKSILASWGGRLTEIPVMHTNSVLFWEEV